jgi:DNA-binding SARP family transcriptional activator
LLALLALRPGEPVTRDRLAGLLWSESDQQAARASLRMALLSLRRVLDPVDPDLIRATNESIMLDVQREAVDWALFESLCARPDAESRLKALELYRGDLLAAFPAPPETVIEILRDERERLRGIAIAAGLDLISTFEVIGEWVQVRSIAYKVLTIEPANEPAHQAMIRAHAAAGDRSAALRQYEQCCEALDEHYDLGPSAETIALRNEIIGAEASEHAEPTAQARESVDEEAVPPELLPKQRRRFVWRRLVPAAFAIVALALALIWFWPPPAAPPTVIVLLLKFDKAGRLAAENTNEIRKTFEKTLRQFPCATVFTQAAAYEPPSLPGDSFFVDAIVKRSNDRLRIFVELRGSGSIDPLWRDKLDFDVHTYERLAEWLETVMLPALRSEIVLVDSSDCRL